MSCCQGKIDLETSPFSVVMVGHQSVINKKNNRNHHHSQSNSHHPPTHTHKKKTGENTSHQPRQSTTTKTIHHHQDDPPPPPQLSQKNIARSAARLYRPHQRRLKAIPSCRRNCGYCSVDVIQEYSDDHLKV